MKLVTLNERQWLDANANSSTVPVVTGTIVTANQVAAITALTDSSTGTSGGNTVPVVTNPVLSDWDGATVFPSAAEATAIVAAITALKNDIATLVAKQNAIIAAMISSGVMI